MKKYLPLALMSFLLIILAACGKDKYEIDKELSVEFNGFNEHGEVSVSLDEGELYDKLAEMKEIDDDTDISGMYDLDSLVSDLEVEAKPDTDLKNGDKVELELKYDEDNPLDIAFKLKEPKVEVEGLESIKKLSKEDVFDGVKLQYEGVSPYLEATIDSSSSEVGSAFTYFIPDGPFKSGEEIEITAEASPDLLSYGYEADDDKFSKKVKVPSEQKYVEKWEDLNKDDQQYILDEVQDNVTANVDPEIQDSSVYDKGEYVTRGDTIESIEKSKKDEQYILFAKKGNSTVSTDGINALCFIYKNKVTFGENTYTDGYDNQTKDYFSAIAVENLIIDKDGNLDKDEVSIDVLTDTDLDKAALKNKILDTRKDEYTVTDFSTDTKK
ncbi:hypothetical protein SFC66_04295 [Terribacillus saccharophilus]|uniref:hypothetical protein n=1 Tax=Terribacillus saccharophilus TaxID=361277 RepID=UPI003982568E